MVKTSPGSVPAVSGRKRCQRWSSRAEGGGRFAWEEFFYAEHHNPHTQKAYMGAVKRFLAWAEAQGVELPAITPGMVGQYLVGLGGSPPSGTCICRRYAASSTGWSIAMSSSSTRRRRSKASRKR